MIVNCYIPPFDSKYVKGADYLEILEDIQMNIQNMFITIG